MPTLMPKSIATRAVLCAMLLWAASLTFGQAQGDVDGDGSVTHYDAIALKEHLLEKKLLVGTALTRADGDGDGKVRMADLAWINNHAYRAQENTINLPGNIPLVMVRIPAGSFSMGSPNTERSRYSYEGPVHTVTINSAFSMGRCELTQKQWLALMGSWPGPPPSSTYGAGDNYPAYYVSWNDAQNFITALNTHVTSTGQGPATYRLPSEAEWEYACRAGTQTRFFFGDSLSVDDNRTDGPAGTLPGNRSDYMWFGYNNDPNGTKQVGTKWPNQFGLYDMSGNVAEWCQDWWHVDYTGAPTNGSAWEIPNGSTNGNRVMRSGLWGYEAYYCRSANRGCRNPAGGGFVVGFRLSRTE